MTNHTALTDEELAEIDQATPGGRDGYLILRLIADLYATRAEVAGLRSELYDKSIDPVRDGKLVEPFTDEELVGIKEWADREFPSFLSLGPGRIIRHLITDLRAARARVKELEDE